MTETSTKDELIFFGSPLGPISQADFLNINISELGNNEGIDEKLGCAL